MLGTNKTGTTIAKGKAVYVSGATGNHPEITLAQANAELSSASTIGITAEEIANNGTGKVIVSGRLENVNTNGFAAGDTLYLSASSAGGFTTTFPTQPNHGVLLGYVTRANTNTGVIEVVVKNYQELGEQSDVLLTSKTNNDLLAYESSSGLWKNKSFSTLGLALSSDLSSYLLSSTAASTYAPLASPTFTGTVTIPAGASISGYLTTSTAASTYAPLASPALTGTPTAPTAAGATNTTQIATTAFVQQEVPAASTTSAGKVELATDAEAIAGTSTTLAVTPSGLDANRLSPSYKVAYSGAGFTQVVGGSGLTSVTDLAIQVATGANSSSYGIRRIGGIVSLFQRAQNIGNLTFSTEIELAFSCVINRNMASDQTARVTFGKLAADNNGDLTRRGFGIRITGTNAVELQVHDGTNLANVSSSFSYVAGQAFDVRIVSKAGTVTLFINDSSVATSSAGPTGNNAANTHNNLQFEIESVTAQTASQLTASSVVMRFAR
jgi:hypothetical protein